ncbi:MAG: hypothetical protein MAG715_00516 [Methanonatronarchaeales archaeon]|nr:hypothetical protein [Methanonatronarchaeales archaeon]
MRRELLYLPVAPLFFLMLVAVSFLVWAAAATTGSLLGFSPVQTAPGFFAIVLGGGVNVPVNRLRGGRVVRLRMVRVFGIPYPVPGTERSETVLAINLGGAVTPVAMSGYILAVSGATAAVSAGFTAALTAILTNAVARPVRGLGIVVPTVLPGLSSAIAALTCVHLFGLDVAFLPRVAFAGGVVGALVGADLMNLKEIANLGALVASIGGAGTFDGILVTGVTAVLMGSVAVGL